ncbi:phytoene dehydrogenase-like protein [Alloalcanivorax xenomutans]|uniref:phytoene desaturase family protein n=1 Tax=Alloalcanivorax xenomutans TaxID=1094342 RepID=UPI000BDB648B|nr:NAD(P)/FAD-dependent oxidoreductase [Alloalcanivorax xenomutans]SOC15641.1 phytoene dehydrogenase-like protein [Alloalcanivorax xenomutans]
MPSPSTLRIGRRYRANRLQGPYDVLVIGSGIGGLSAAACLSKLGKKVAVFEQHYTAGGFTHAYERNGYEWDVGVHYIGDVGKDHTLAKRLFDHITDGQLQWAPMDPCYDRIHLGDRQYDLMAGPKAFVETLKRAFPDDHDAIDRYMKLTAKAATAIQVLTTAKVLPGAAGKLLAKGLSLTGAGKLNRPTAEVLGELTDNHELIAVLTGQWGDNGLPPEQSSFLIHAIIARHYLYGGFYPVGGASAMATTIIPVIQQGGGDVFTYADVREIVIENGRATGLRLADDNVVSAPVIISDAGVFNTFQNLLPDACPQRQGYLDRLTRVQRSMASACLYVGLNADAASLGLPKTNFWIYPDSDYQRQLEQALAAPDDHDIPLTYISFPSAKDPSFSERYPGRATIEIVAAAPYEWFQAWDGTPWGKRGDDYDALKEAFSQRLLEKLFEKMPHLREHLDYYELSTPLSTAYFCRYPSGEIYGLNHDPNRFEQQWLRPKTTIPGLYLTGQDVLTCGVAGAMIAGLVTAISVGGVRALPLAKAMFAG